MTTAQPLTEIPHPLAALPVDVSHWVKKTRTWDAARRWEEAHRCADLIASAGDLLLYGSPQAPPPRPPKTHPLIEHVPPCPSWTEVYEALACGLGILAHRASGVSLFGRHWCALAHPDCPGPGRLKLPELDADHRSDSGSHYTPMWLADLVTYTTLEHLPPMRPDPGRPLTSHLAVEACAEITVADLACGSGAFLVATTRHLVARIQSGLAWLDDNSDWWPSEAYEGQWEPASVWDMVVNNMYGADTNAFAVGLCRTALSLLSPSGHTAVDQNILVGDSLLGMAEHGEVAQWAEASAPGDHVGRSASSADSREQEAAWLARVTQGMPLPAPPVHWFHEFPHIFDNDEDAGYGGFDAIVGNPPFLGGQRITGALGARYRDYLVRHLAQGRRGSADLCAYFLLRATQLLRGNGQLGLIATNTLLQGATRRVAYDPLTENGRLTVDEAIDFVWPLTSAAVHCLALWARGGPGTGPSLDNGCLGTITDEQARGLGRGAALSRQCVVLGDDRAEEHRHGIPEPSPGELFALG